uniref:ENTH domain-containing protein n=1 Tax=Meloidogyne javanica TaxID=6303 RepID=A0A915M9S7_MELJA
MSELLQGIASLTKSVQQTLNSYEVRKLGDKVQGYVMNFTETEQKVREATNEDPWGPTGPEMQEIASLTFQYDQFTEVMGMLWKRLLQDNKMAWRRVYKSLILLNYLLKNGSERVISTARDHSFEMRALESYKCVDERGKDEGANVRHRVKLILELLNDDELLRNERRKAKADGREKYQGFSKDDMLYRGGSNSSKFDSFERWNEKKVEKDEREDKQKEWKSTPRSGSNSARREVTAFDFDTADNSRSRASGSPELGIRERTPEPLDEAEDEEFGDFTSARAAAPTNGKQTLPIFSSSKNISLANSKPVSGSGGGDVDLLGLDLIGDVSTNKTTKIQQNFGNFDPFSSSKNLPESNIIFIERPKSQQQQSLSPIAPQNVNTTNFVQSTPSIPSAAPELLDLFSSPTQPIIQNVNIDFDNLSLKSPVKATPTLNELKKSSSGGQNISSSSGLGQWQ